MSHRLIVVVGSGPGIGTKVPSFFASKGFNAVALLSRNAKRLEDVAAAVTKASSTVRVETYPVDVGDSGALEKTLDKVQVDLGKPEVVLFNAARVATSKIGEESAENVLEDLKVMSLGLYCTASWALPLLEGTGSHPCFFLSGGQIWKYPSAVHFSLSMNKGAQTNFMGSLAQVANPKGVHVAIVDIGGVVKDDEPVLNAANVAKTFWELYEEDQSKWRDLVALGDIREQ